MHWFCFFSSVFHRFCCQSISEENQTFNVFIGSCVKCVWFCEYIYPVCSLYSPDQSDSSPHVNVSVQSSGVRQLVFGGRNTQDGLQVARLPENPPLWSESVSAQRPELSRTERGDTWALLGEVVQTEETLIFFTARWHLKLQTEKRVRG